MYIEIQSNGNLAIVAEREDRKLLKILYRENPDRFHTDAFLTELLEPVLVNSEYDWCDPTDITALTSAPILCTRADDTLNPDGSYDEVVDAWGFMDYAVRSVQQDLMEIGRAVFIRG